jgi:NitT/TauT family transport system substrate-binding protein
VKRLWIVGAMCVLAALLAACGNSDSDEGGSNSKELTEVKFALISPQIQPAVMQFWIGSKLGYFEEEGIKVDVQTTPGVTDALQRLLSNGVDVTSGTLDALFAGQKQGQKLPVKLYYQYQLQSAYAIAVDPSSPIQSVSELGGKRVGVISTAESGYFYARALLESEGINPDDVEFVTLQGPALLKALQDGDIDAVATFTSQYAIWETEGYEVRRLPPPDEAIAAIGNAALMGREESLEGDDRRKLVAYARGMLKATIFAIANPDAACRAHFDLYPETLTAGRTYTENLEACKTIWIDRAPQYDPPKNGRDEWGGPMKSEEFAKYAEILGYQPSEVNPDVLFTNDLLEEINRGMDRPSIEEQARTWCDEPANQAICEKK